MKSPPDVSIVIVSYNTRQLLRDCLGSISKQTRNASTEIVVVDNASTDGSCAMVTQCFPQVTLIANSQNRGFAAANNQAIKLATGRHLLLLNSDTIILDSAIDKCVEYLDAHHDVGVVGARAFERNGNHHSTTFRFTGILDVALNMLRLPELFPKSRLLNHYRYGAPSEEQERDVDVVAGCFLMVRHEIVKQIGGLDEDFFIYGEEAEWCYRIRKADWRVVYYPEARIIHLWGGSSKKSSLNIQLAKRRGQLLFLYKTRGAVVAWVANLIMFIGLVPRVPVWLLSDLRQAHTYRPSASHLAARWGIVKYHLACLMRPKSV